jgi:hypothetical protein
MPNPADRLRAIKTFPDLVRYLEDELDGSLQECGFDELTFEYSYRWLSGLREAAEGSAGTDAVGGGHRALPARRGRAERDDPHHGEIDEVTEEHGGWLIQ